MIHDSTAIESDEERPADRVVQDRNGGQWRVRLADCRRTPGAHRAYCLIFDSSTIVRRLWDYPAEWRVLPDAALAALAVD